ncbi:MAG: tetratricopeptide repeat protein, partial [Vicinamibacterales bacterium]
QAWDKALDLSTEWTKTYPREAFAFNSLGLASGVLGQHEQAVAAFEEAIRLDPAFVPPWGNLARYLIALNRFDRANTVVQEIIKRGGDTSSARRAAYLLAFLRGDPQALARELEMTRRTPGAIWAFELEARTSAFAGRTQAAHALYQHAVNAAIGERLHELAARWAMEDAETHAIAGQCDDVRKEVAEGLALNRDNVTLERAGRAQALCRNAEASHLSDELAARFPGATVTARLQRPVIAAALALSQHDFARAVRLLDPVKPYDFAPDGEFWPAYLRGEAYLGMKDGQAAAPQFQSILDHRGVAPTSPLYALAHRGAARAAALAGDRARARASFETFFSLWSSADNTRLIDESRAEYARLR